MNDRMVEVNELSVSFGEEVIHKDLSFQVNKGEKFVITGESGTGKSTLLNVLAGFIPDFQGEVKIDGILLNDTNIHEIRKKMAWLPQDISLNVDHVHDLFYAPFQLDANKEAKPNEKEVKQMFEAFDISTELLENKIDEISGGQKQRILLASCLLLKKPLLLVDEPTSALDQFIKEKVSDYVLDQKDLTVIAVTHDTYWTEKSHEVLNLK